MTLIEALRPYLWLAAVAFIVGFLSYLAMGRPTPALAEELSAPAPAALMAPASDEWNIPKRI